MATRRESVQLDVTGNYVAEMSAAAAATQLMTNRVRALERASGGLTTQMGDLDSSIGRTNNNLGTFVNQTASVRQGSRSTSDGMDGVSRSAGRADSSINQLTGRLGLFADAATILGPGLVPIAAVGATAIGGLAIATTAATTAAAAAVIAFQGVGDAVKASNAYAIDPTAENLVKLQVAMKGIGPDAQSFVRNFQAFIPTLTKVRDATAAGVFPGLIRSLDDFEKVGPRVAQILNLVGTEFGNIVADSAESFTGPRWVGFLGFLRDELPDALRSVSKIMGDFAHGFAVMLQRLDPGNDRFLGWLEDVADGFDRWASSSQGREDIRDFLDYARESGPEVAALFLSLTKAIAAIAGAAAPLGGPVLEGLTAVVDLIGKIAESDAATPLLAAYSAFRLYARGAALAAGAQARLNATQRVAGGSGASAANLRALNSSGLAGTALGGALLAPRPGDVAAAARAQRLARISVGAQGAALGGMVALTSTGLGDLTEQAGASNTAMLTLLGTMIAPGWGTAAGAVGGTILDLVAANNDLADSLDAADSALANSDLTSAAQNLAKARDELAKYRKEQDIGSSDVPSFKAGLQNVKDDFKTMFGGKSDGDVAEARIKQLEDYYHAQYQLSKLKPVSNYDGFNHLFGDLTGWITPATNALNDFTDAMKSANTYLGYQSNVIAYEAAIDAVTKSIRENGKSLDVNTVKGRENKTALLDLATTGVKFAESMTGTKRTTFLRRLAVDIRDAANKFDMPKAQVDALLEKLGLLDRKRVKPKADLDDRDLNRKVPKALTKLGALNSKSANPFVHLYTGQFDTAAHAVGERVDELSGKSANPFVNLYTGQFDSAIGGVSADLRALNGDSATVYINTVRRTRSDNEVARHSAEGGSVPKTGLPYADRHLYMLADGEEIISNRRGQADRFRADRAAGRIPGYADGGTTGRGGTQSTSAIDLAMKANTKELKELKKLLEQTNTKLDKARQKREDFKSYRTDVAGSLAGDLTGNGLAGFDAGLSANRNNARSAIFALLKAKKKGLDGPLFDLVAASGDLNLIQQFAALSSREIAQRERRYGAANSAQNSLGNFASEEKFDTTLSGINKEIRRLNVVASKLGKEVQKGAERGTRLGQQRKSRQTSTGTRAGR